jgi:glutathione S-transferase-like protein
VKLYVCWGTWQTPRPPRGHPCHNAYKALREAGHDPEVVRVRGLGIGPLKWMTEGRKEVEELTGQPAVPVLVTDEGEAVFDSRRIVDWANAHPAGASPPAAT